MSQSCVLAFEKLVAADCALMWREVPVVSPNNFGRPFPGRRRDSKEAVFDVAIAKSVHSHNALLQRCNQQEIVCLT
jgi:hypothetical protein